MAKASLICIAGPLVDRIFTLDEGRAFLFGRHSKAHYTLATDPSASQLHFLIDTSDSRVRAIDMGSTNGLLINNVLYGGRYGKTPPSFVVLNHGDIITAGSNQFRLDTSHGTERSPAVMAQAEARGAPPPAPPKRHATDNNTVRRDVSMDNSSTLAQQDIIASTQPETDTTTGSSRFPEIPGYTILEKIGMGGRGAVYKAIHDINGDKTAIKILLRRASQKPRASESFTREIQITKRLSHPNIIRYLGDGITDSRPYLALEYVGGGNLDQCLRALPDRRMQFQQAIPLFIQLLEAVSYMHREGLVHKDIKPKNILLDLRRGGGMAAKLSDMGLTSRVSGQEDEFLPVFTEGGTPAYMPPEQVTDITKTMPQSDVFSAAATAYQMLSGKLLYDFKDADQVATILDGNIMPLLHLCPHLPGRFAEVINKALSYYPENRYADGEEMLHAVKVALE